MTNHVTGRIRLALLSGVSTAGLIGIATPVQAQTVLGTGAQATGAQSTALGAGSSAEGDSSTAVGDAATASGRHGRRRDVSVRTR